MNIMTVFASSFPILILIIYFSCHAALVRMMSKMVKQASLSHSCLKRESFNIIPLSMMFVLSFLQILSVAFRIFLFILGFLRASFFKNSWMGVVYYQMLILKQLRFACISSLVSPLFCQCGELYIEWVIGWFWNVNAAIHSGNKSLLVTM